MQKTEDETAKQCPASTGKKKGKKDFLLKTLKIVHYFYSGLNFLDKVWSKISEYFDLL